MSLSVLEPENRNSTTTRKGLLLTSSLNTVEKHAQFLSNAHLGTALLLLSKAK